tara:strand:- start:9 stop:848 length:840 start_codon:yes stop_codon:yes gene_type:complete
MEQSRDDFIIAIRSAFLKKGTKQRFSLLFLLFFSVLLLFLGKYNFSGVNYLKIALNEIVYRSSFIVSIPEKFAVVTYKKTRDHFLFYNEYDSLKEKFNNLESNKYNVDFLIAENKRLRKTLEEVNYLSNEQIAKVLIDKESPFLRSIIINKGSKNNIQKGMAVLANSYLVGKVIEVNFTTSRVLLLSDLNSKTPISIEPGGIQAILSGTGKNEAVIQYTKDNLLISNQSIVYTSGTGDLFKAGIPIGKIFEEDKKKKVDFFADFSQLRFVKVTNYSKEN